MAISPRSPDLNPIENHPVKRRLAQDATAIRYETLAAFQVLVERTLEEVASMHAGILVFVKKYCITVAL